MDAQRQEILSVAEQAAHWLRFMDNTDPQMRVRFWEWMSASPLHVRELLIAMQLDQALGGIDPERRVDVKALIAKASANVMPLNALSLSPAPRIHRRFSVAAIAAGCACALIGAAWWGWSTFNNDGKYSTRLGEQRMFDLPDGSVIFLNTQSRVQVHYTAGARDIDLHEGQASFQAAKDPTRPFRVHAAGSTIQAIGTQFDVRLQAQNTIVAVVEGAVKIDGKEGTLVAARVAAGEGIAISEHAKVFKTEKIDIEAATAWRRQRLIFRSEDLATISDEFNRYNIKPRLSVEGKNLRARKFHGTFNAHSPESLLIYLGDDQSILIERRGDEVVMRERHLRP